MNQFDQWLEKDGFALLFVILGAAILYYFGGKLIAMLVRQIVRGKRRAQPTKDVQKRQKTLAALTVHIWRITIVVVGALSVFKIIFPNIDLSPLFASAGIVGIAVAFGSQAIVKDFLTGLFIVADNQYRVGDVVEINGAEGKVERVGTRTTVIRDYDGNVHYIPNGSISHVVNMTMGYSRVNFSISLAPDTDLDTAIGVVNQTGEDLASDKEWADKILTPPSFDSIESFSSSAVVVRIVGKVEPASQWAITNEMRRRLLEAYASQEIKLS